MTRQSSSKAELQDAKQELAAARALFDEATDPDMIDRAIALTAAAESRLRLLLRTNQTAA